MAIKGLKSTQLANDPTTSALKFNFKTYEQKHSPFRNNSTDIDFVTYNGSLYVCVEDGTTFKAGNPADNGFLLLVQKGADGRQGIDGKEGPMGPMPNYTLSFDGKQMVVVEQPSGVRKAVSPDLTGPVWVPELHDKKIVWNKEEYSVNTRPEDIDLEQLRPTEERPLLLRVDSDNTKRSDETSGPANMIQWKHEGDEYWTNLISISELMNLALAGVCFWTETDVENGKEYIHFGHKEVLKATYDARKLNNGKKIAEVELGEVLFDAGKVPFPEYTNYDDAIQLIRIGLGNLKNDVNVLKLAVENIKIPDGIATENWVRNGYQPKGNYLTEHQSLAGLVKSIKLNGTSYNPNISNGEVDLGNIEVGSTVNAYTKTESDARYQPKGNYLTEHQSLAGLVKGVRLNNGGINSPDGQGIVNLTIGDSGQPIDTSDCVKSITINGDTKIPINGNVEFTLGNNNLFNLTVRNGHLIKIVNGIETDLGAIGSSGSGSTVTVSQVLLSGTKIATITVDGTDYDIYAPNTGGSDEPGGENGISLDLTNEINTIPVDKDNKTLSTASFLTELHVFSGSSTEIDFTAADIDVSVVPNIQGINVVKNIDSNPKKFQININSGVTLSDDVKISFTLWANDSSRTARTAVYTLVPLRLSQSEMFYLELDPNIIKIDSEGNYTSETISATPHWLLDGNPQSIVGWNDSSKINDVSVKYHVYYKIDSGAYTFYTNPVNITSATNQVVFELRYYYNNNKTDYIVMDGPEHVLILRDGQRGPDGVSILSQVRYYKASSQSTGVTAPNVNVDPTLPANGGWLTTSNSMQLSENEPYLWFFERIEYSNERKWQSDPVIIRYFNAAAQADYEEITQNVLEAVDGDIRDLDERLSVIVDTNGDIITDGNNGLISVITNYTDSNQKSFADLIVDAKEATIKNWAGSAVEAGVGRTLTSVKNELDGIDGKIATAATQARSGAVSDARTEWRAADASITTTATKAQYVWMANDGSLLEYTTDDATNNRTTKTSGGKTYTRTLVSEAMSAIKQTSDKVEILVGQNGDVKASVIADAINNGNVTINANKINLLGETIATAIQASEISADQITSGTLNSNRIAANSIDATKINATNLQVAAANITGQLTASQINTTGLVATAASFDYLTVGGQPISANNSLNIVFGNSSTISNPQPNTIYFIYNT